MKRIKTIVLALMLMLSALCLVACGSKEEKTEIAFVDDYDIPAVRIGVEYNFEPYFTKEKGTSYDCDKILESFYSRLYDGVVPKTDTNEFKAVRSEVLQLLDKLCSDPDGAVESLNKIK